MVYYTGVLPLGVTKKGAITNKEAAEEKLTVPILWG